MTIYNINMGIGWASSGVEYAQLYRAKLFRRLGIKSHFIFTDLILNENIEHLTANIGFKDDEVIWLYHYFTDVKLSPTTFTLQQVKAQLDGDITQEENQGKTIRIHYGNGKKFVTCYMTKEGEKTVDRAEYVSNGNLIRKDYYNYTRYCSEYFTPRDGKAHLYQRRFFNEDGSVAFEEIVDGDNASVYRFKDHILTSRSQLLKYFLTSLNLSSNDFVIVDRSTEIGQSLMEVKNNAKIACVVHAEHYSENAVTEDTILWNNYYEYEFTHTDDVDYYICSTQAQSDILAAQFKKYQHATPKIVTIPVGSLDELTPSLKEGRKSFGLVSASRLASEKHLDWVIHAVIKAKESVPELTLDIYGKGVEEEKLKKLIEEHQASHYIRLMGHADLRNVYRQYDAYIAGSTSEGFGLSLMEAIGSGLPIIGFRVPYGNVTFVDEGRNGLLFEKHETNQLDMIVSQFESAIIELFTKQSIHEFQLNSYKKAEQYLSDNVAAQWKALIEEVETNA